MSNHISIGITGTRDGLNVAQMIACNEWFQKNTKQYNLLHGDCVGVDVQIGVAAENDPNCVEIEIFPPIDPSLRAFHTPTLKKYMIYGEQDYLYRNRLIASASDVLLAFPKNRLQKGGTWYTINYARKLGTPVLIFETDLLTPPDQPATLF